MSSNSSLSWLRTSPIVNPSAPPAPYVGLAAPSARLLRDEGDQLELADLDLVAGLEQLVVGALAVDVGAVEAADVVHPEAGRRRGGTRAWRRDTVMSSRKMSLSGWRPTVTTSRSSRKRAPAVGAADADQQRGARLQLGGVDAGVRGIDGLGDSSKRSAPVVGVAQCCAAAGRSCRRSSRLRGSRDRSACSTSSLPRRLAACPPRGLTGGAMLPEPPPVNGSSLSLGRRRQLLVARPRRAGRPRPLRRPPRSRPSSRRRRGRC